MLGSSRIHGHAIQEDSDSNAWSWHTPTTKHCWILLEDAGSSIRARRFAKLDVVLGWNSPEKSQSLRLRCLDPHVLLARGPTRSKHYFPPEPAHGCSEFLISAPLVEIRRCLKHHHFIFGQLLITIKLFTCLVTSWLHNRMEFSTWIPQRLTTDIWGTGHGSAIRQNSRKEAWSQTRGENATGFGNWHVIKWYKMSMSIESLTAPWQNQHIA